MQEIVQSKIRCPKCKNKEILLIEIWKGHEITWQANADGFFDRMDGNLESGDPFRVEARCSKCDHQWKVRNASQIGDAIV